MIEPLYLSELLQRDRRRFIRHQKPGQEICFDGQNQIELHTDRNILKIYFFNIISNAIKYSEEDIHIVVEEKQSEVSIAVKKR